MTKSRLSDHKFQIFSDLDLRPESGQRIETLPKIHEPGPGRVLPTLRASLDSILPSPSFQQSSIPQISTGFREIFSTLEKSQIHEIHCVWVPRAQVSNMILTVRHGELS